MLGCNTDRLCKLRWGCGEGEPQSTWFGMLGMGRLTAAQPIWCWFILNFSNSAVLTVLVMKVSDSDI